MRQLAADPAPRPARRRLALVVDPRFSGGTGTAVAAEVRALSPQADLRVFAIETAMFKGRGVNPALQAALHEASIEPIWNPPVVRADTIVFHNPSCLKFDAAFEPRMSCDSAFVVTHENFLRPGGSEGFDVAHCLALFDTALVCRYRRLAPVSCYNRRGVAAWLAAHCGDWALADFDWPNICDLPLTPPTERPRDRRGRHSRAGLEKFPPLEIMLRHFPPQAESCTILGADSLLLEPETLPRHWKLRRFGEIEVARFLDELDFFIYFTHPQWRESFGRVIAEAIAAGKVVITDPGTAEAFGDAVVASQGEDVDEIVAGFIAEPGRYGDFVRAAQASLERFRPEVFARHVLSSIASIEAEHHALL